MNLKKATIWVLGLSILALSGCIVSGTFVFTDVFSLTINAGYSHEWIDITDDADWEDAKDDIDRIESVGFEIWFTNNNQSSVSFDAYVSDPPESDSLLTVGSVQANGTQIIEGFTVAAGQSHMSYKNSFDFMMNVETLKTLAKGGQFHVYGISSGAASFTVDSAKVIITLNASATP